MREPGNGAIGGSLSDSFGRIHRKLRISVTDRCNFRCTFCMPTHPVWLPHEEVLSFEEIERVTRIFASLGIEKIRLSGGEPLVRQEIEELVLMLARIPGIKSVSMTTNGFLLGEKAKALKEAGLKGVTVSLHSLKPERFATITGTSASAHERVLAGIRAAQEFGLRPLKVNAVIIRGCNEDELIDLATLAREGNFAMRFIEFMPFDGKKVWGLEKVVTGKEVVETISREFALVREPREASSTAKVFRFADGHGEIGLITSVSEPFCSDCDRVRLKCDGKIVPCLWSPAEYNLKPSLRGGASDEEIAEFIKRVVRLKDPGVETLIKERIPLQHVRPMHTIGG